MSEENIVDLPVITRLDLDPERVLKAAIAKGLKHVVILGEYEDGTESFATSIAGGPEVLWMLERAKLKLLRKAD